jgi:Zonular occludens toxin (Zot)
MPVTGFVGLPGSGKTLRAVQLGLEAVEGGRQLASNLGFGHRELGYIVPACPLVDGDRLCWPVPHRSWEPDHSDHDKSRSFFVPAAGLDKHTATLYQSAQFRQGQGFVRDPRSMLLTSWAQVIAIRQSRDDFDVPHRLQLIRGEDIETEHGAEESWTAEPACELWRCKGCSRGITIIIDELNLWAPSRLWQTLGVGVLNRWAYVRKDGLEIIWTAQHEARIDKVAREVTDFIYSCRAFGGVMGIGKRGVHLQIFHRRKWVPALMTDKNRISSGEGAKASGAAGGVLDWETAFWIGRFGSMRAPAAHYNTYEHVTESAHLGRKAAAGGASRRTRPERIA